MKINNNFILDVEQEVHDIAIFDDVIFPFSAHLARFLGALLTLVVDKVFKGDGLGANKAFFKVSVDLASRLRGSGTDRNSPGAYLFHTGGEVGLQVEQLVAGADNAVQGPALRCQGQP